LPEDGSVRVIFGKEISEGSISGVETVVFCGELPGVFPEADSAVRWIFLNPSVDSPGNWEGMADHHEALVLLGSSSGWQQRFFWENAAAESGSIRLREVAGAGRFLPGWEKLVFAESGDRRQ